MIKWAGTFATVALSVGLSLGAETFPFKFKTIDPKDIPTFPGGYGLFGQLRGTRPAGLKKEPTPASRRPLYGETSQGEDSRSPKLVFRVDESKGDMQGYDQLIVDINQNGDLTDDPVIANLDIEDPDAPRDRQSGPVWGWHGPVKAPPGHEICGGQPIYYAQVYALRPPELPAGATAELYGGYVRFRPGWYLEAAPQVEGKTYKVGLYDGDGDLRLGVFPEATTYQTEGQKSWYFPAGDSFLVDANNSGVFDRDVLKSESLYFSPVLYLGGTPCRVSVEGKCETLRVEPIDTPLANVLLEPAGSVVQSVTLGWEQNPGAWRLITVPAEAGKIHVPPGKYRLYECLVVAKAGGPDQLMVAATQRTPKTPVKFEVGKPNTLKCGAPLEVVTVGEKRRPEMWELSPDAKPGKDDSEFILRLSAKLLGADGETYATFRKGSRLTDSPARPTFAIYDSGGKEIANGNLEYG